MLRCVCPAVSERLFQMASTLCSKVQEEAGAYFAAQLEGGKDELDILAVMGLPVDINGIIKEATKYHRL